MVYLHIPFGGPKGSHAFAHPTIQARRHLILAFAAWSEESLVQSLQSVYRLLFYLPLYRWVVKLRFYLNNLRAIIYFIFLTLYKYYIRFFIRSQILNKLFYIFPFNFDNNTITTTIAQLIMRAANNTFHFY